MNPLQGWRRHSARQAHHTPTHANNGLKFEIWLELLMNRMGHQNVRRNVEFHQDRYLFRQVDLSYQVVNNGRIEMVMIEAKYTERGIVPYQLRNPVLKNGPGMPCFTNVVEEVRERQIFVGASKAYLVTNGHFEDHVRFEAARYQIRIVELEGLSRLYWQLGFTGSINDSIKSIDPMQHNRNKSAVYISRLYSLQTARQRAVSA